MIWYQRSFFGRKVVLHEGALSLILYLHLQTFFSDLRLWGIINSRNGSTVIILNLEVSDELLLSVVN